MKQKCVVKDGSVVPCKLLDNVTEDLFTRVTKGVFELQISTLSTGEYHTKGFGAKSGKHKKRGIMFNYCPFCGEDIGSHLRS